MKSIKEMQVNELVNQRTPLDSVVPLEAPFIVNIDPSGACNFNCVFCPCNTSDYMSVERHKIMSFDLFKKIVDDMKAFKQKVQVVDLYAFGEPLLNNSICKMIEYLKTADVCKKIRMTTNGSLLNEKLNDGLISSGLDILKISIEGITNNDYKKLCKVDVSIEEIIHSIKDLYSKKMSQNIDMLIQIKAVNSALNTIQKQKTYFKIFGSCSDSCIIENVKDIWSEFNVDDRIKNLNNWEYERITGDGALCSMPLYQMTIHSNGVVSACCVDWKFETEYGNVCEDSVRDIWHSQRLRDFQIFLIENGRKSLNFCKNCTYSAGDNIDFVVDEILFRLKTMPLDC